MPLPSKDMATTKEVVDPQASQLEGKQESTDNSMDKERSEVWVHFKKQKNSEGKLNGKAICVWCGKSYQALSSQGMTHPHPLLAAGVPATPQKSPAVTSND